MKFRLNILLLWSKFSGKHEDSFYFRHLLESMHEILPIRRISSDKLALCSMLTYVYDRNTLCNTIIRGFTCATEANILVRNIYVDKG